MVEAEEKIVENPLSSFERASSLPDDVSRWAPVLAKISLKKSPTVCTTDGTGKFNRFCHKNRQEASNPQLSDGTRMPS